LRRNAQARNFLCGVIRGDKVAKEKVCGTEKTVSEAGNTSEKVLDCSSAVESTVVSTYTGLNGSDGSLVAGTSDDPQPSHASNDTGSFCNGGNNSGPFNTKGGIPQGGGSLAGPFGSGAGIQ